MKMCRFKFRGKRIDNDEWVYGNLLTDGKEAVIANFIGAKTEVCYGCCTPSDEFCEVNFATVGQFVGQIDRFNVEIYDGDILRDINTGLIVSVIHNDDRFSLSRGNKIYPGFKWEYWGMTFDVIGDVYSNPEWEMLGRRGCMAQ